MELMELVFKELIVIQQLYFNQKKIIPNNFVLTICKYLISRIENPKTSKILYDLVNNPKLEIDNIKVELLEKNMDNDEDDDKKIIPEKLKSKCKKYKINYYKINILMKKHLQNLLNNKKLILIMKEEKTTQYNT